MCLQTEPPVHYSYTSYVFANFHLSVNVWSPWKINQYNWHLTVIVRSFDIANSNLSISFQNLKLFIFF